MNRRTVILAAILIVAIATALGFFWPFGRGPVTLRLAGIVEIQEVRLGSKVGGRVLEVFIREGDLVEPKDKLVEFEVPELLAQEAQMRAKLAAAAAEYYKAKEGPRMEEKEATKSAMKAAEAMMIQAVEEYERTFDLYRRNAEAKSKYDAALAQRNHAEAKFSQAKWDYRLMELGTREEDKAVAKSRVEEIAAKLSELRVNLQERIIYAPEKAVVEVLAVRKGDLVPPGQPVVRVLRAEDLWVKVYVPETELGKVRLNQEVEVRIDSYPDKAFKGVVNQIASISEFTPRNVQTVEERRHQVFGVKVRVADAQGVFRAGMAAEVTVPLQPAP